MRISNIFVPVANVTRVESLRNEDFNRLTQQLRARISEDPLGLRVDENDASVQIDDDHGIGSRLEQSAKRLLGRTCSEDFSERCSQTPLLTGFFPIPSLTYAMLVGMASQMAPEAAAELLRRYSIIPPHSDGAGARALEGGHTVSLGGHRRSDGAKLITLTLGNVSESRFCPFEGSEAADIVRRFQEQHLIPKDTAFTRMLEHLVELAAKLYAYEQIESFVFDAVKLHESDYRIGDAHIFTSKVLHLERPKKFTSDEGFRRYDARSNAIEKNPRRS